ncbi:uncharacterized protein V3H82_004644 [Fundulus diaphanus]
MGSPVSPIVANLYMEEMEKRALGTFRGTPPSHWFRYVDDTFVKIQLKEVEAFTRHMNSVDNNIKFTREDANDNKLPFLDCLVNMEGDVEVYRKPTHTDQYLLFDSHHPLEHKLSVIRTLQHRAEHVPTKTEGKHKEQKHIKDALQTCGYPNWAFVKSARKSKRPAAEHNGEKNKRKNIVIPYVAGVSEKLKKIFSKHKIPVHFKPNRTLRQRLVHPKDKTPKPKMSGVVYAVQCSEECSDLYIGETKQPLHRRMAQHRRATSSGQDSAVHQHLKDKGHSFEDQNVHILDKEDRWFERGVKEAIYVKREKPTLNRGGGLRFQLSKTYNTIIQRQELHVDDGRFQCYLRLTQAQFDNLLTGIGAGISNQDNYRRLNSAERRLSICLRFSALAPLYRRSDRLWTSSLEGSRRTARLDTRPLNGPEPTDSLRSRTSPFESVSAKPRHQVSDLAVLSLNLSLPADH